MEIKELDYEEFEKQRKIISPNSFKPYKSRLINGMKILCETKEYESYINEEEILKEFLQKKDSNNKYLKEVFDDKSPNDLSLYTSLPSAFRKYKNYVLEGLIINKKRDLFIEIAKYHDLEYQKTNATYFQIYPKNILKEGRGGTHYEFISENSILFLEVHIESKATIDIANFKEKMKLFVEKSKYNFNTKIRPIKIDISKYSDDKIQDKFNELYSEFQPFIEENYKGKKSDVKGENNMENKSKIKQPLNQILYGPPGTGKTYNTINKALEIIDNEFYLKNKNNREILKEKFEEYKENGHIEFITFHQSYGYEEFVEGIKAIPVGKEGNDTKEMIYDVVDGVLKRICKECTSKNEVDTNDILINENTTIWKMSLGNSQNGEDKYYYEEALNTDTIIMGYGNNINFSNCNSKKDIEKLLDDQTTVDMIDRFKHQIKSDDIVIISDGNRKFKAIVQVVGDYYFDETSNFNQKRKIKWLQQFSNSKDALKVSDRYFTQVTLNKPKGINKDNLINYLSNKDMIDNRGKSYVLIIDEINRGNISKIFGELITLIEDSKRLGSEEALEIALPYSGEKFGVPNNLYILGTMNTADRSIALMDTALRRRFDFEEMIPNPCLLYKESEVLDIEDENTEVNILELNNWNFKDNENELFFHKDHEHDLLIESVNLRRLLYKINQRIEYLYDRDHMIGHAYFIGIKTKEELDNVMRNKIIPLLQEYFYDDWEKIQIVLGDHKEQSKNIEENERFIIANKMNEADILGFDHDDIEDESISYRINGEFIENAYIKIYKKLEKKIKEKKDE